MMLFSKNILFYLWLFLLPFSWVISYYTQFLAIDKLIAPVLLVLGMILTLKTSQKRANGIFVLIIFAVLLLIVKHISFLGSGSIYGSLMWEDGIKIGYFLVPLLCISNREQFVRASWLVVVIAMIGCISVFMVALDLLVLPLERFEITRLGEGGLRKSIGLFASYGDMAQYVSFAVMWVVIAPTMDVKNRNIYKLARVIVFISVLAGLASAQSRNLLLSIILGLLTLWVFKRLDYKSKALRKLLSLGIVWTLVITLFLVVVFFDEIIVMLSSIGGGLASKTVTARMEQYAFAIDLIKQAPLLGADASTYIASSATIDYIHNMWLRLAAHGGLVTVLVVVLLFSRIFAGIRKTSYITDKKQISLILSSYFVVMLFSSMFYVAMGEMFWALLGIAASFVYIEPFSAVNDGKLNQEEPEDPELEPKRILTSKKRILSYKKTDT